MKEVRAKLDFGLFFFFYILGKRCRSLHLLLASFHDSASLSLAVSFSFHREKNPGLKRFQQYLAGTVLAAYKLRVDGIIHYSWEPKPARGQRGPPANAACQGSGSDVGVSADNERRIHFLKDT